MVCSFVLKNVGIIIKIMNKIIRLFAALLVYLGANVTIKAQTNPQEGYIITNQGDTIHGIINYLTDAKNAKTCLFQKNGDSQFVAYTPRDIQAYRLANDGIYYVSREFTEKQKAGAAGMPIFAEFLIKGGISLYRYNVEGCDYYQFVNSDGQSAMIKDDGLNTDLSYSDKLQVRKSNMQSVALLLYRSPKLLDKLWKSQLNAENVTDIVKNYNERFCTEEGECIQFRYDRKKAATIGYQLFVGVGVNFAEYWYTTKEVGDWFSGVAPKVTVGVELLPLRTEQHWLFSAALGYSRCNFDAKNIIHKNHEKAQLEVNHFDIDLGAAFYPLSKTSKIRPFLRGGISSMLLSSKAKNMVFTDVYTEGDKQALARLNDGEKHTTVGIGWVLGAGIDVGRFRIGADYKKWNSDNPESHLFSATLAVLF